MLATSNYDNMCNVKKNCNPYPSAQGWSILAFIQYQLLFKNFTDLQYILNIKKNFCFGKKNEMLKI